MPATLRITQPTSGSTVSNPITVSGDCSVNHQITVTFAGQTNTPTASGGTWSTSFRNVAASPPTYTITATCDSGNEETQVTGITVS
jgi:hypothetical protein